MIRRGFKPHKYTVRPVKERQVDGFTFDSKTEMEWYLALRSPLPPFDHEVLHVDVHPKVTLGPGDRLEPDFLVWYADGQVEAHDVKSTHPERLREFRRLQKRWRHPAMPLIGITCRHGKWERLEPEG